MMRGRLASELRARLDAGRRWLVTLAYGANDAAEAGGKFLVPIEEYVENLEWAIDEVGRLGGEAVLLGITPVAPSVDGARNAGGRLRSNAAIARYNEALAGLAKRKSAALIDVNGEFAKRETSALFVADGVHPNAKGHALIFELVRDRLLR
jgi:lysophospholipase L1-like esterase